ncbi:hypothetical protein EDD17DRAFT_1827079 [Pisolithus thermaeus]|nr:hypothetical protein EDD17DRAFT_1827079 [Pisolithus thermaeus]
MTQAHTPHRHDTCTSVQRAPHQWKDFFGGCPGKLEGITPGGANAAVYHMNGWTFESRCLPTKRQQSEVYVPLELRFLKGGDKTLANRTTECDKTARKPSETKAKDIQAVSRFGMECFPDGHYVVNQPDVPSRTGEDQRRTGDAVVMTGEICATSTYSQSGTGSLANALHTTE